MGALDRTICDCCVCPMQCVLEQLIDKTVSFFLLGTTGAGQFNDATIERVEGFKVFTNKGIVAFHTISFVILNFEPNPPIKVKPTKNDIGECACIEDSTTNLLNSMKKKQVVISDSISGTIDNVGEGIILLKDVSFLGSCFPLFVISKCFIDTISPST
ncbi:hypothetical protein [Chengkuizengella marina]|uniref:Uncharacterized protein n=1 Tax=Chengkuizengella marina TaxID=2507566 RepID=A0A6N9PZC4_9BACL|nr:hypothetical protein [Chengkuizengella marina]NBI28337.1 hypothetical protein [Chengkuizengella marina]